jgi:hypothetical protein
MSRTFQRLSVVLTVVSVFAVAVIASGQEPPQAGGRGGGAGAGPGGFGGQPGGFGGLKGIRGKIDAKLPEGLRFVPTDAAVIVYLRVGDFLNGPYGQACIKQLRASAGAEKTLTHIEASLGVKLADIESVTLFVPGPPTAGTPAVPSFESPWDKQGPLPGMPQKGKGRKTPPVIDGQDSPVALDLSASLTAAADTSPAAEARTPLFVCTATRPLDRRAIFTALAGAHEPNGHASHSVLFLSDRSVLVGNPASLARYTTNASKLVSWRQTGPLYSGLSPEGHVAWVGMLSPDTALPDLWRAARDGSLGMFGVLLPLLHTTGTATLDLREHVELMVRFNAISERDAALAQEAVQSLRTLTEMALEAQDQTAWPRKLPPDALKALRKGVARATIEGAPDRAAVELRMRFDLEPEILAAGMAALFGQVLQQGARAETTRNLKEIGLAMHAYLDTYKTFPPPGIGVSKDNRPNLSWRVAILPFIEQAALYKEFDLNVPWDHPNNKKLIARMPKVFADLSTPAKEPGLTRLRVLVGNDTMFPVRPGPGGFRGVRIPEVTDGTSNTFMVVEAREPVEWTRPDDLPYDPKGPLPKLGIGDAGFHALFADASVRFLPTNLPEEVLRAYITRSGGEIIPDR